MKDLLSAITFGIILVVAGCQQPANENTSSTNDPLSIAIDSIAQDHFENGHLVGFSIAVLREGDTLYNKAFGYSHFEDQTLATTETKFALASVTKLHTATAVMKLVESGKLSLDETLLEVMPDFPRPEQASKITIRHMLSHTSGMVEYAEHFDSLFIQEGVRPNRQAYLDFFATQDLNFEPGTSFSYSNTGFLLMAFIIEKAEGGPYEDYIEETIAQPLGLTTLKHLSRNFGKGTSRYYQWADPNFERSDIDSVFYFKGDGGLSATALDLAHVPFGLADGKIISRESLEEMMKTTDFPDGNRTGYGLGMRTGTLEGHRVWGHTGGHRNYFSTLYFFPEERISIAVLNNTDDAPTDALLIAGDVALAVLGEEAKVPTDQEESNPDLRRYVGDYSSLKEAYWTDSGTTLVLDNDDQHLYRKPKGSSVKGERLYYLGDRTFAYEKYPLDRMVFNFNTLGEVVGFQDYYNGYFMTLKKTE